VDVYIIYVRIGKFKKIGSSPIVSTGVYTVEFSLREDGNTHFKGGLQDIKPFFSLRAIKTDVVDEISLTYKLYSVMLVGLIPSFT
jgi:hypothetical protein